MISRSVPGKFFVNTTLRFSEFIAPLNLAVVAVGGFAVAPRAVDLHVLGERVFGDCYRAAFLSSPNTGRRAILRIS
jgi:hypothetical protein